MLVAIGIRGTGAILAYQGPDLKSDYKGCAIGFEIDQVSPLFHDHEHYLEPLPTIPGLYVWEGEITYRYEEPVWAGEWRYAVYKDFAAFNFGLPVEFLTIRDI